MIIKTDSIQTRCTASTTWDGQRRALAQAISTIRPGQSYSFSLEVLDDVPEAELQDVKRLFGSYLSEELIKAAATGIPIAL